MKWGMLDIVTRKIECIYRKTLFEKDYIRCVEFVGP
jgi:hypothetical protein